MILAVLLSTYGTAWLLLPFFYIVLLIAYATAGDKENGLRAVGLLLVSVLVGAALMVPELGGTMVAALTAGYLTIVFSLLAFGGLVMLPEYSNRRERHVSAGVQLALILACIVLFTQHALGLTTTMAFLLSVPAIIVYVAAGILTAVWMWYRLCKTKANTLKHIQKVVAKGVTNPESPWNEEIGSRFPEFVAEVVDGTYPDTPNGKKVWTYIVQSEFRLKTRLLDEEGAHVSNLGMPKLLKNRLRIANWILGWPVTLLHYAVFELLGDLFQGIFRLWKSFFKWIYNQIGELLHRVRMHASKGVVGADIED